MWLIGAFSSEVWVVYVLVKLSDSSKTVHPIMVEKAEGGDSLWQLRQERNKGVTSEWSYYDILVPHAL